MKKDIAATWGKWNEGDCQINNGLNIEIIFLVAANKLAKPD